ncbi:MAG: hypothetical protein ACNI3C_06475 [Candidatus Marinarcus sp.]|uniref:hypothetical protein n=1 Tax=Candidatus Marinarcus sp. TaxID=3100987 RepID=UPI003AFFFAE9
MNSGLLAGLVKQIVYYMKYDHDMDKASMLVIENKLTFEEIMRSTVKLSLENLATLADKVISKK